MLNKVLFFLFLFPFISFSQNEDLKNWDLSSKIEAEDFKGEFIENKKMSAMSVLSLKVNCINNSNKIFVLPVFDRNQSYIIDGVNIQDLLIHEQLHFDILELFARKIRKKLIEYYEKVYDIDINFSYKIYDDYLIQYNKYDMKYDLETEHSKNKVKQKEWNNKVKKELEQYKEYTNEKYLERINDL